MMVFRTATLAALLLVAGLFPASAVNDEAVTAKRPPKLLSEFGFFADLETQEPAGGVIPFAITTPLFSDYAEKRRFVYVPEGKSIAYDDREAFDFPTGSALIKTFAYPDESKDGLRLIETRVLLKKESGWDAWAYLWNDSQTDAERLVAGKKIPMTTTDPGGESISFTYTVPNKNQCKGCHALDGEMTPIGPKARNLNGPFYYADGLANQLDKWIEVGILGGAAERADRPFVPDWQDETAAIDQRARAWLDVNCAHCHRRGGPASNSGLFLTWHETDPVALGIRKRPVAAGRGSAGLLFDIVPGSPEESILLFRAKSREPGIMMPELGRSLTDQRTIDLLSQWIESLR